MSEKFVTFAWAVALRVLDAYLDGRIAALKDENAKATLRKIEDEVVRILEGPVGKAIAKQIGRQAALPMVARLFPNDPTSGVWG